MSTKYRWISWGAVLLLAAVLYLVYDYRSSIAMLNPKGLIAEKELNLIIITTLLMLLVVIPVFILTVYIAVKFHAGNKDAEYKPNWDNSVILEIIWWGFPCLIIIILSVITWKSSHELDPYRPLESDVKPVTVQVVSMQWKWLFIYPEQGIATVNFIQVPEKTPINFEVTSDAPMNSFWLPQIGGQIYAMPGMKTKLHLIVDEVGEYTGSSANISGHGFSGMVFKVKATTPEEFDKWVEIVKQSGTPMGLEEYKLLAQPSSYNLVALYKLQKNDLFQWVVMKPMMPMEEAMLHKQ